MQSSLLSKNTIATRLFQNLRNADLTSRFLFRKLNSVLHVFLLLGRKPK